MMRTSTSCRRLYASARLWQAREVWIKDPREPCPTSEALADVCNSASAIELSERMQACLPLPLPNGFLSRFKQVVEVHVVIRLKG
jgi:hypothetical protein